MAAATDGQKPGALDGIRVLDFTQFIAGPYCTRLMADLGAEVVKIEAPGGDILRAVAPLRDGHGPYFGHFNVGKRSLVLDLKQPAAIAVLLRMLPKIDVVLENYRPGVMDRLGLGYDALSALRPDLIFCSVSGYGQSGPKRDLPAFAPIVHATSGFDMMLIQYQDGIDVPLAGRPVTADVMAASNAFSAILAALFHRERSGEGQRIDISLLDSIHHLMPHEAQAAQFPGQPPPPVYGPMRARDGHFIVAPVTNRNFAALARAIDRADWMADPRFATPAARLSNWTTISKAVEAWAVDYDAADCERRINAEGCPCARYRTVGESIDDPHVVARGSVVDVADAAGRFRIANTPMAFSGTSATARGWVPGLGEHGAEILRDLAGLNPDEIAAVLGEPLREAGD